MIYNKKVTALVPIKGETEMIDGRLRLFNNKPLYMTLIDKLQNTYAIDEIIVDSDLHFIEEELTKNYSKVRFIRRPQHLLKIDTDINNIIQHDIEHIENNEIFIQTHINKPLLRKETIAKALKKFVELEDKYDSLFSVTTFHSRFYNSENQPINHKKETLLRTKDLTPVYEENSCFYIFSKESFNKCKNRIGNNPYLFNTANIESMELKDGLSYKLAEILLLYQEI